VAKHKIWRRNNTVIKSLLKLIGNPDVTISFGLATGLLHLNKFRKRPLNQNRLTLIYICLILIMLAFDTETNPGPTCTGLANSTHDRSDLCGICTEVVGWHPDRGIYCEECSSWYHAQCQGHELTGV